MADLDDFFAKKDKKKSKGKKFTTVDQVAKKLEDTSKKPVESKPKKDKEKYGQEGENDTNNMQEDEWKEFEEEKKDYSGLKIQNMQLDDSVDQDGQGGEDDDSDDGEGGDRKAAGPWKMPKNETGKDDSDEDDEPPPAEPEPKRPEPKESSSYIAPALRNAAPSSSSSQIAPTRGRTKAAPDINNEAYFPTLSAAAANEPVGPWGKKSRNRDDERGFEDVRNSKSHSSRLDTSASAGGSRGGSSQVVTGNKWSALRHSES